MGQNLSLGVFIGLPLVKGFVASVLTAGSIKTWYRDLKKPKWTAPNWLFGPAWTALYTCMGTSAWLIWRDGGFKAHKTAMTLYGVQLALNFLWTPLFFGARKPGLALIDAALLDAVLVATLAAFFEENKVSGSLLVPYMGWMLYATALTAKIARDNKVGKS